MSCFLIEGCSDSSFFSLYTLPVWVSVCVVVSDIRLSAVCDSSLVSVRSVVKVQNLSLNRVLHCTMRGNERTSDVADLCFVQYRKAKK